jgi:hypothetical protein
MLDRMNTGFCSRRSSAAARAAASTGSTRSVDADGADARHAESPALAADLARAFNRPLVDTA